MIGDHGRTPGEHDHDVREIDSLADAVGDEQHGGLGFRSHAEQEILHLHAGELIERAERLVHQQELRAVDQGAAQRNPLLHATGELRRIGRLEPLQAHDGKQLHGALARCSSALAADFHREQHVFEHRAPRHQIALLKRDTEIRLRLGDSPAVDLDNAAGGADETAGYPEEGRLAAAARPEQGH